MGMPSSFQSICPYCGVGCGLFIQVEDGVATNEDNFVFQKLARMLGTNVVMHYNSGAMTRRTRALIQREPEIFVQMNHLTAAKYGIEGDGMGPALIERLQGKVAARLIDAGEVPENYSGPIEAAGAEVILIVDAADLKAVAGATAGDVALIELEQLGKTGISTHNASLGLLASVVQRLTGADVLVLAVQPKVNSFGAAMSEEVGRTLERLEEMLSICLRAPEQPGKRMAEE